MDKLEKRILLIVGTVALVVLAIVLVQRSKEPDVVVNDFTPPPFEAAALAGEPEVTDESLYGTLSLSEKVSVSLYSSPVVTDGAAQVFFTSLPENEAWPEVTLSLRSHDSMRCLCLVNGTEAYFISRIQGELLVTEAEKLLMPE